MPDIQLRSYAQFETLVTRGVVLLAFSARWCAPCRRQAPILDRLERTCRGRARVVRVDVDASVGVALAVGIQSIPTLVLFADGIEVNRFIGLQEADTLAQAIDAVQGRHRAAKRRRPSTSPFRTKTGATL